VIRKSTSSAKHLVRVSGI